MNSIPDYARRGLNRERLAALDRHAGKKVLDVGCGNGSYVLHLAGRMDIRGVDYRRFDAWSERPELFDVCDAQSLTLPDGAFDTLVSFETLEHLPDPARALREYYRVTRGNLIVTVPNCELTTGMKRSGVIYNHWIDRTHVNFWDLDGLADDVRKAGFRVDVATYINHVNLGFLAMESLGLEGSLARAGAAVLHRLQRRRYPMTCLLVASRPEGPAPGPVAG